MTIKDTISVVQTGISQLIAANYMSAETPVLTETNVAALAELGKTLENTERAVDIFMGSLVDTLSGMRIESRKYAPKLPSLFVDVNEWGGFKEYSIVGLSDVLNDEMYPINGFINYSAEGGVDEALRIAAIEHGTYKPDVMTKFYDKAKPFMIALSTIRDQLFTAVRNLSDLQKIISALQVSVNNTIALQSEVAAFFTVDTGIARAIALNNEIKLVTRYNAAVAAGRTTMTDTFTAVASQPDDWALNYASYYTRDNEGLFISITGDSAPTFASLTNGVYSISTVPTRVTDIIPTGAAALNYPDFVKFALETIANTKDEFTQFSAVYNNHTAITFSDDTRLILLAKFSNRAKFGVRANTYNEQLLGIGEYEKINSWQAVVKTGGSPFAFDAVSSIALTKAAATKCGLSVPEGATGITLNNIIGCMYDRYAMGITLLKEKTTSNYIAAQDKINTFHHIMKNYIINDNFPIAVFTLN